jgi:hypothetical protein
MVVVSLMLPWTASQLRRRSLLGGPASLPRSLDARLRATLSAPFGNVYA